MFVNNSAAEIMERSSVGHGKHVKGLENTADDDTREKPSNASSPVDQTSLLSSIQMKKIGLNRGAK